MTGCRAIRLRPAAAWLLVFCLAFSAILHFASQGYPDPGEIPAPQPGISAPETELALTLANKVENPCSPELAPAVFVRLNFLRLFGLEGGLRRPNGDRDFSGPAASAFEIRGPPDSIPS